MFQPLTAAIGLRYLRAKRRNGFISFISLASVLGIFIGVVALITTISVMNGFQEELRNRILGTVAHASIEGVNGSLSDWKRAVAVAETDERVLGAAPYVQTETLLQAQSKQGALLRGVQPELEGRVSELPNKMIQGRLDSLMPGTFNIVLGSELAAALNVRPRKVQQILDRLDRINLIDRAVSDGVTDQDTDALQSARKKLEAWRSRLEQLGT